MKEVIIVFITVIILFSCCAGPQEGRKIIESNNLSAGMKITSTAFKNNDLIPEIYSCKGKDINPPLKFEGVPQQAKSLALIIEDPDAPSGTWIHWIVWNISVDTTEIMGDSVPVGAIHGTNSGGVMNYGGPCPPSGTHRYFFKLYALGKTLNLPKGADRKSFDNAIDGYVVAQAQLIGLFSK